MNKKLARLFEALEKQRHLLVEMLMQTPSEKLNAHPPGKWSINQIIAHLIAAERLSIQYLNKKILAVDQVKDSGLVEELKMLLLVISQRVPLKYKAPRVVLEQTAQEEDLPQLAAQWTQLRGELKTFLDRVDDRHVNRKIYKHVRVGMLNVKHALKFFGEHVHHHTPQIKRLL